MATFREYFFNSKKTLPIHKWHHYLDVYEKHLSKFKGKNPKILEIGLFKGGSVEMWNKYFNGKCEIYGIDIDKDTLTIKDKLNLNNLTIHIGDQGTDEFWNDYLKQVPAFDIIIEDGGHHMHQQIKTFERLTPTHLNNNGVYICEDLHTSYWKNYGGGLNNPKSFIEYSKKFIDYLHYDYMTNVDKSLLGQNETFARTFTSVAFYDSIVVLDKNVRSSKNIDSIRY